MMPLLFDACPLARNFNEWLYAIKGFSGTRNESSQQSMQQTTSCSGSLPFPILTKPLLDYSISRKTEWGETKSPFSKQINYARRDICMQMRFMKILIIITLLLEAARG